MSSINATVVRAVEYGSKLTLRRPSNEGRRARYILPAILVCAGLVYFWRIGAATNNPFYTVAVRSMAESWKAFFFGSFNPGNSITIDKIPGYLWPQALSARVFGFHPWALTLPEVVEAFVTVIVTYRLVRGWAGEVAGLFAAAFLVLTPALVGAARLNNEESAFTMCLVLAAAATQRAVTSGRLRSLVLAGVWVGLAFQCKMVEAWAVLPALAAAYLLAAPPKFLRRLLHVAVAGVVTLAVSVAWIVAVALIPAADRPYIDGTTNNNPFSMVFGYNALTRFGFLNISPSSVGSVTSQFAATSHTTTRAGGGGSTHSGTYGHAAALTTRSGGGSTVSTAAASYRGGTGGGGGMNSQASLLSMFERTAASQVGWFYALALVSIVAVLWLRRREPRTDAIRAGFIMWSIWLVIYGLAYSEGEIHTYYVVTLGPALAAVCGAGVVELWRAFRAGGRRAWLLPLAVAANVIWAIYLVDGYPTYRGRLIPVLAVLGLVALAALLTALLRPAVGRRALVLGGVAGVLAVAVAPGAWAASVITSSSGSVMGNIGPGSTSGRGGFAGFGTATTGTTRSGRYGGYGDGAFTGGFSAGSGTRRDGFGGLRTADGGAGTGGGMAAKLGGGSTTLTTQERKLLDYAEAHDDGARFTLTVTSWDVASPYILSTGADVLPMGGFTGAAPFPTLAQFEQYVKLGEVRFVVLPAQSATSATGTFSTGGFAAAFAGTSAKSGSTVSRIEAWVREDCPTVAASAYGGSASTSSGAGTLYECTRS